MIKRIYLNNNLVMRKFLIYNNTQDNLLIIIGSISAVIAGLLFPSISYVVGSVSNTFGQDKVSNIQSQISTIVKYIAIIAFLLLFFTYVLFAFWQHAAENIVLKLRVRYLECL